MSSDRRLAVPRSARGSDPMTAECFARWNSGYRAASGVSVARPCMARRPKRRDPGNQPAGPGSRRTNGVSLSPIMNGFRLGADRQSGRGRRSADTARVTGAPLDGLGPRLALAALPRAYFAQGRETQLREVQAALPDGLRDLLASVAAGRSLTHALCTLATSGPEPLRDAFGLPGPITHARHGRRARDRRRGALGSDE